MLPSLKSVMNLSPRLFATVVGFACSQGWLFLAGLLFDGYVARFNLVDFAGPSWMGYLLSVVVVFLVAASGFPRRAAIVASRACSIAFAFGVLSCFLLIAARTLGSFDGLRDLPWKFIVFLAAFGLGSSSVVLSARWLAHFREWDPDSSSSAVSASTLLGALLFLLVLAFMYVGSRMGAAYLSGIGLLVSYILLEWVESYDPLTAEADIDVRCTSSSDVTKGFLPLGRLMLAGILMGCSVGLMLGQFLGARHGIPSGYTMLIAAAGIPLAILCQLVFHQVRGVWAPEYTGWFVAVFFLVAYYPFNPGSDFSLKFAVAANALAMTMAACLIPAMVSRYSARVGRPFAECSRWFLFALAVSFLILMPVGYLFAFTEVSHILVQVTAVASMVAMFVACTFLLSGSFLGLGASPDGESVGNGSSIAGNHPEGVADDQEVDAQQTLDISRACDVLAAEYGLTSREVDVLRILAEGYDVTRVQEVLCIAEGTALTHKRHIYSKLNVHTRLELLDLVHSAC